MNYYYKQWYNMETISRADQLGKNTLYTKLGLWTANIRDNLPIINKSLDINQLNKLNKPILCIAAGDSYKLHFEEIKKFKGVIISCERNLIPLLEHEIIPNYVVSIDGSDIMTKFIDNPVIDLVSNNITGIFATTVSPSMLSRWQRTKVFFNAWIDDINEYKSISLVFQELTKKSIMHTGGNCGTTLWFLAQYLEASHIVLIGLDLAYPITIPDLSYTQIWNAIKELPQKEILDYYRRETNCFGNTIITDYSWEAFKDSWLTWVAEMNKIKTIQCSDYTIAYKEPLSIMTFSQYLKIQERNI